METQASTGSQSSTAPGAVTALTCGIIGIVLWPLGLILGPIAIMSAMGARRALHDSPTLEGKGLATAGLVLGIVGLVLAAISVAILVLALVLGGWGAAPFIFSDF